MTMTGERHAWATLHLADATESRTLDTCPCGQPLDTCSGRHCPRCGNPITPRAA